MKNFKFFSEFTEEPFHVNIDNRARKRKQQFLVTITKKGMPVLKENIKLAYRPILGDISLLEELEEEVEKRLVKLRKGQ